MGKLLTRGDSEYHLKDQLFHLVQCSNITLFLLKTCRDCISSARKFYQEKFLGYALHAGRIGKETFWSQTEELEKMDASEIHAKRLNAKEVLTPMNWEKSYSRSQRTVKLSG